MRNDIFAEFLRKSVRVKCFSFVEFVRVKYDWGIFREIRFLIKYSAVVMIYVDFFESFYFNLNSSMILEKFLYEILILKFMKNKECCL